MVQAGVFSPAWVLMSGNQNHPVIMGMNGVPESSVIIRDWRRIGGGGSGQDQPVRNSYQIAMALPY